MPKLIAVLVLSIAGASAAQAMTHPPTSWWIDQQHNYGNHGTSGAPAAAPEIDPSSAIAGLTLLIGGLAVIRGRRRS
ncbi:MAG TPA: hypothetical protein VHX52_14075 [Steroidobacteraceae bacterium]|jgi:hypothetical protein|nr:hypothetical protein [Steroidobacteraceae bacterium]